MHESYDQGVAQVAQVPGTFGVLGRGRGHGLAARIDRPADVVGRIRIAGASEQSRTQIVEAFGVIGMIDGARAYGPLKQLDCRVEQGRIVRLHILL